MLSFPILTTPRITLRAVHTSDAPEILYQRSDPEMNKYIERPENRKTKTLEDALAFIQKISEEYKNGKSITWGITPNNERKIIGTICLWNFSEDRKKQN